jgi:hypothetical protein
MQQTNNDLDKIISILLIICNTILFSVAVIDYKNTVITDFILFKIPIFILLLSSYIYIYGLKNEYLKALYIVLFIMSIFVLLACCYLIQFANSFTH